MRASSQRENDFEKRDVGCIPEHFHSSSDSTLKKIGFEVLIANFRFKLGNKAAQQEGYRLYPSMASQKCVEVSARPSRFECGGSQSKMPLSGGGAAEVAPVWVQISKWEGRRIQDVAWNHTRC